MADGSSGADGGGGGAPFDYPFPAPLDDFDDDVLHLLDIPLLGDDVAAAATPAPVQSADGGGGQLLQPDAAAYHGSTGDDLLDWSSVLDSYSNIDVVDDAPPPTLVPPPVHGVASTSPAAPAAPQEDTVDCSGCQVLREVVHSNGLETTKLCIHGGAGAFYHAMLDVYRIKSGAPTSLTHHSIIDFRGRGYDWVKQYLTDYAFRRATGGFAVVQDSLSAFHDTLCTTMACSSHVNDAHKRASSAAAAAEKTNGHGDHQLVVHTAAVQPVAATEAARTNNNGRGDRQVLAVNTSAIQPPASAGPSQASHTTSDHVQQRFHRAARSTLAIQRERTKKLGLDDVAPYFDQPIAKAARKLSVCATALKAICRKNGVQRWPYRKVRSINTKIATLRRSGNADANEIETLIASRRRIVAAGRIHRAHHLFSLLNPPLVETLARHHPSPVGDDPDKPTPPSSPPPPVLLAATPGDGRLCRAAALSRKEVIRRRRRRLLQLYSLYRAKLWALADALSARHAEYWWEHGASPVVAPDAGNTVAAGGGGGAPSSVANCAAPPPHATSVNGGVRAAENAAAGGRARCSAANCRAKAMPLTSYCFNHILCDSKQRLYKPCAFVTKRSGTQNGVKTCGKPVLKGITPLRCSDHDPKSQRLIIKALKKVGIHLPLTSKGVPKLSLLICESVRQIQMKRIQLNGAKNVPFHRSSQ